MRKQWTKKVMIVMLAGIMITSGSLYARGNKRNTPASRNVWMTELNLNSQQMLKINALRDDMQPAMMDIRHQIRKFELELSKLNRSTAPDQASIDMLRKSIFDRETAIQAIQTSHYAQIRGLLTAEQQMIFDARNHSFSGKQRGGRGQKGMQLNCNGAGENGRGRG